MEHQRLEELRRVAEVHAAAPTSMTRRERLERWAELLEKEAGRRLSTLPEIEYRPRAERAEIRSDNSPLTVAYADPVLRLQGLASDRLGDAMEFFSLTDHQVHNVLCSCLSGATMDAREAARRVRLMSNTTSVQIGGFLAVFSLAIICTSILVAMFAG
jgi:hypothetical protein